MALFLSTPLRVMFPVKEFVKIKLPKAKLLSKPRRRHYELKQRVKKDPKGPKMGVVRYKFLIFPFNIYFFV